MYTSIALATLCSIISISSPLNLNCKFQSTGDWWIAKDVYHCKINTNFNIKISEESVINSIKGNHLANNTNSNVKAFVVETYTVHYFPTGMENFFKNLELIDIRHCHLREVHQADIKLYPKLRGIVLYNNDIEVLENGLFDYNLNLEMVWISQNKLIHIGLNVFDYLYKLTYLSFESNLCISMSAKNSSTKVKEIIEESKEKCQSQTVTSLIDRNEKLRDKLNDFKSISRMLSNCTKKGLAIISDEADLEQNLTKLLSYDDIKKSLRFLEQKIDRISGEGSTWKSTRFIICIISAAAYSLTVGLSMIYFYKTYI